MKRATVIVSEDTTHLGTKNYPGLDLIRFSAALLVTLYHLAFFLAPVPIKAFSHGWVGVEIFFVISGFVIAFSADGKTAKVFVISRAARLYPAAIVCSTIIAFAMIATSTFPTNGLLLYFKSMFLMPVGPWLNNVFWTLPVEMAFYALVSLSLWRKLALSTVAICLGLYSTAYWLFVLASPIFQLPHLPSMQSGKYAMLLLHYGVFFSLGMLLYQRKTPVLCFLFLIVTTFAVINRTLIIETSPNYSHVASVIWIFSISFIWSSVQWNHKLNRIRSRKLGLATYPLYLVHSTIGVVFFRYLNFPFALVLGIGAALIVSFAVLPLERQARRIFVKILQLIPALRDPHLGQEKRLRPSIKPEHGPSLS